MTTTFDDLVAAFEGHDVERIQAILDASFDVKAAVDGKTPVSHLVEMYFRSDRFPACLRLLLERGAVLEDPKIVPILLNDPVARGGRVWPLGGGQETSRMGGDVNARADFDAAGMNGHTPLFHTVNSNANRSAPLMQLLLEAGARADVQLQGITWGKGFAWETTCFDVTPISYAQMGLLPQMQRIEQAFYDNVRALLHAAGCTIPPLENVPNRYLAS